MSKSIEGAIGKYSCTISGLRCLEVDLAPQHFIVERYLHFRSCI